MIRTRISAEMPVQVASFDDNDFCAATLCFFQDVSKSVAEVLRRSNSFTGSCRRLAPDGSFAASDLGGRRLSAIPRRSETSDQIALDFFAAVS